FGSPGSLSFNDRTLPDRFLHITHEQDPVGTLLPILHASQTMAWDDYGLTPGHIVDQLTAHNSSLYWHKAILISQSPLSDHIPFSSGGIAFLDYDNPNSITIGSGLIFGHAYSNITFGGGQADYISVDPSFGPVWLE